MKHRKIKAASGVLQFHEQPNNRIKAAFIRLCEAFPDKGNLIGYDGRRYTTGAFLTAKGIILCPKCGYPQPVENKQCIIPHCHYNMIPDTPTPKEANDYWPVMPLPQRRTTKEGFEPIPRTRVQYLDEFISSEKAKEMFKADVYLVELRTFKKSKKRSGTTVLYTRKEFKL